MLTFLIHLSRLSILVPCESRLLWNRRLRHPKRTQMTSQTRQLFGTDGIRGVAGDFPLSRDGIFLIGRALGHNLRLTAPILASSLGRTRVSPAVGSPTALLSGWPPATLRSAAPASSRPLELLILHARKSSTPALLSPPRTIPGPTTASRSSPAMASSFPIPANSPSSRKFSACSKAPQAHPEPSTKPRPACPESTAFAPPTFSGLPMMPTTTQPPPRAGRLRQRRRLRRSPRTFPRLRSSCQLHPLRARTAKTSTKAAARFIPTPSPRTSPDRKAPSIWASPSTATPTALSSATPKAASSMATPCFSSPRAT